MKLISLNTWGGEAGPIILDFFKKNREVDIFLLQEVFHHATEKTEWTGRNMRELFNEIEKSLPDHQGYFAPSTFNEYGLAGFIRKEITVNETADIFVFRWKDSLVGRDGTTLSNNMQYFKITHDNKDYTVANLHGLWNGKGKTDTEERLEQSRKIKHFLKTATTEKNLLCGDFNLAPDTKSLAMLEEGARNLIKEYGVTSTRSELYTKDIKFADYVLVSPAVEVKDFRVLQDVVSDHLPLLVEFN
jgi:exonuclease III